TGRAGVNSFAVDPDADPPRHQPRFRRIPMRSSAAASILAAAALLVLVAPAPAAAQAWAPQNRPDVSGREAAVVSDHPLATAAGADVLRRGGNAVDAAITMAAVLAVVRPHMNGVGGDAFGLFFEPNTGRVTALNGSGR